MRSPLSCLGHLFSSSLDLINFFSVCSSADRPHRWRGILYLWTVISLPSRYHSEPPTGLSRRYFFHVLPSSPSPPNSDIECTVFPDRGRSWSIPRKREGLISSYSPPSTARSLKSFRDEK